MQLKTKIKIKSYAQSAREIVERIEFLLSTYKVIPIPHQIGSHVHGSLFASLPTFKTKKL
jgi:hypothetical protein